jgi:hypothetical protein
MLRILKSPFGLNAKLLLLLERQQNAMTGFSNRDGRLKSNNNIMKLKI